MESSAGTCTFAGIFVLSIEWASSKYRVFGTTLVSISYPLGEMLLGLVAMYVHDFRYVIRILYTPGLLILAYFWLVPESVRWLLVTGQIDRAIEILKRTAKINGKKLSEKSIEMIKLRYSLNTITKTQPIEKKENDEKTTENESIFQSLYSILKSKTLLFRFLICSYQWMACCFSYYGLSLTSTHIPGANRYISFIFVSAVEIPSMLICLPLLNRINRRKLMFFSLILAATGIILIPFIPAEQSVVVLLLFMMGKASITCAFTTLYVFTAEQWPTQLRSTIHNSCSMLGRLGAMVAPMTAILVRSILLIIIYFKVRALC